MLRCGSDWQPTKVERVVETFPTSTRVAKVATDAGLGFLKGIGNPAGTDSLACELIAAELASWIGLRTPPFALVSVSDIEIPLDGLGVVAQGPAFITAALQGTTGTPGDDFIKQLRYPHQVARLVVFDTWIRNGDRCPPDGALDPSPNYDNLFFVPDRRKLDLIALDHSHVFVETTLVAELGQLHLMDERLYGLFPEFAPYLTGPAVAPVLARLKEIDAGFVADVVGSVPPEWGVNLAMREALVQLIVERAAMVCEFVPAALGLQGQLAL